MHPTLKAAFDAEVQSAERAFGNAIWRRHSRTLNVPTFSDSGMSDRT